MSIQCQVLCVLNLYNTFPTHPGTSGATGGLLLPCAWWGHRAQSPPLPFLPGPLFPHQATGGCQSALCLIQATGCWEPILGWPPLMTVNTHLDLAAGLIWGELIWGGLDLAYGLAWEAG